MCSSSRPSVSTCWPRLPITMAVPVSWHMGSTPPAAMHAFLSRSRATYRSFGEACGSSRMDRSWRRCAGRSRWAMSCMAAAVRSVSSCGSISRKFRPNELWFRHPVTGQPPVAGAVMAQRQQVCVTELGHCRFPTRLRAPLEAPPSLLARPSLVSPGGAGALWLAGRVRGPASGPGVARLRLARTSVTRRLPLIPKVPGVNPAGSDGVWGHVRQKQTLCLASHDLYMYGQSLYRDAMRRRRAARCPRPRDGC